MLKDNETGEIRRIAELALAARRGAVTGLLSMQPSSNWTSRNRRRREARPANDLGLAALPDDEPADRALRDAIDGAPDEFKRKLWAVMRIGSRRLCRRRNGTGRSRTRPFWRIPPSSANSPTRPICTTG